MSYSTAVTGPGIQVLLNSSLTSLFPPITIHYPAMTSQVNIHDQGKKGTADDETVGWHHRLNGHESEQTPGDNEGQGSLACCSPWGHKELDMTEQLNNNKNVISSSL